MQNTFATRSAPNKLIGLNCDNKIRMMGTFVKIKPVKAGSSRDGCGLQSPSIRASILVELEPEHGAWRELWRSELAPCECLEVGTMESILGCHT